MSHDRRLNQWNDEIIRGTGSASTDDDKFSDLVAVMNSRGKGTIKVDGDLHINTTHTISAAIGLECLPGGMITTDGASAGITYGSYYYPWDNSPANLSSVAARAGVITSASLSLDENDWIVCYADNALTGITPHASGITYRPMEIHRVARAVLGASNQYVLGDFFDDPLSTSPKIVKITPLKGVRLTNVRMRHKAGTTINSTSLHFGLCVNPVLENCRFEYPMGGRVEFHVCADVRVLGCTFEDLIDANENLAGGYALVPACVNGMTVQHCTFGAVRHGWTTGGIQRTISSSTYRYGTVKDVLIANNTFKSNGKQATSNPYAWSGMTMCDTHTEGVRITVLGNTFGIPDDTGSTSNVGVSIRARDVTVRGNTFNGTAISKPILCWGPGATIEGNTFRRGWYNAVENGGYNADVDNTKWHNNTFIDFSGPALVLRTGTGHEVVDNRFINCGQSTSGSQQKSCVNIEGLSASGTVKFRGNKMGKASNDYSVYTSTLTAEQVELDGNVMSGYGRCSIGLNRSLGATVDLERLYARKNGVSGSVVVSIAAHGLTLVSNEHYVLDSDGGVLDDTSFTGAPMGPVIDVIDSDTFCVATRGAEISMSSGMIKQSYTPSSDGRELWWDSSAGGYKATKPGDSVMTSPSLLVVNVDGSVVNAIVL